MKFNVGKHASSSVRGLKQEVVHLNLDHFLCNFDFRIRFLTGIWSFFGNGKSVEANENKKLQPITVRNPEENTFYAKTKLVS